MDGPDIIVKIEYPVKNPEKTRITTNAEKEALEEILEKWLECQIGQGKDDSKPVERDTYSVIICLWLDGDQFGTKSDTGNKSLTCGIVSDVLGKLSLIAVTN